ncbi:DUF4129 domain-containing protein [Nocardiopsis sp. MG754419]|uniref:DUF4129 domain-containing protein n=1 Tax=Nocardiopsis sp. MG754419 TaxID=2259865 RepID=UPI001BA99B51|nr:DUF4129 domain-containing protein [Nocardiopsis sp. MG754419]MBR8741315.1 hypothetical protein [Nocardiopsis sp. MG754419]
MRPPTTLPAEVTRDEGRRRAIEELSDPLYGEHEPSIIDRFLDWLDSWLGSLLSAGEGFLPGEVWAAGLLLILAIGAVVLIVYLRPSRNRRSGALVHEGTVRSAAEHRAAADRHEADGEYAAAVTERLRAISVDLEDRTIITPRAGRTATELSTEAAAVLPGEAEGLREGARIFNDVAYGDRAATADAARTLRELDTRLRAARPAVDGTATGREGVR